MSKPNIKEIQRQINNLMGVTTWLNPKEYPIPHDKIFLAYISDSVEPMRYNADLECYVSFQDLYNNYGSDCPKSMIYSEESIELWTLLPRIPAKQTIESALRKL